MGFVFTTISPGFNYFIQKINTLFLIRHYFINYKALKAI